MKFKYPYFHIIFYMDNSTLFFVNLPNTSMAEQMLSCSAMYPSTATYDLREA